MTKNASPKGTRSDRSGRSGGTPHSRPRSHCGRAADSRRPARSGGDRRELDRQADRDRDLEIASDVVARAVKAGADHAEAFLTEDEYLSLRTRRGSVEKVERAVIKGLGLKVIKDNRKAYVTGSSLSPAALRQMVAKALSFARHAAADPAHVIPEAPGGIPAFEQFDPSLAVTPIEEKIALLKRMEDAAYAIDPRIANTQAADYSDGAHRVVHVHSRGLAHVEERTHYGLSLSVLAQAQAERQVGSQYQRVRRLAGLEPERVGREAALEAAGLLGAQPVKTARAPVVFDPAVFLRLMYHLIQALHGEQVLRGESFLKDALNTPIAAPHVVIRDSSAMAGGGYADMGVDGEGILARDKAIIDHGVLTTFYHNLYSAHRAAARPTGSVVRGSYESEGGLGPANLYLEPGRLTAAQVIATVPQGLYVRDVMGFGFNQVTGDYSVGASGNWIESGQLAHPVERVTIAARFIDILKGIEEIGSDLRFWGGAGSPTVKVRQMTIAGL